MPARRWPWLLAVLLVLAVYGPSLARHAVLASDPAAFTSDASQHIVPYLRYWQPGHPGPDFMGDYVMACHPIGYRALYTAWAHVADPRVLSKLLPFVLLLATLVGLALAAARWGGAAAGTAVMLLALSSVPLLGRMVGGLPRSFAFPLFAGLLAAAVHGRLRWLAALTLVAVATYPAMAVSGGFALACIALLLPADDRGEARDWPLARRLRLVVLTGLAGVLLALPTLWAGRAYGPALRPQDLAEFPEAGPGGRFTTDDLVTYAEPISHWLGQALPAALVVRGEPWVPVAARWLYQWGETRGTPTRAELFFAAWGLLGALGLVRLAMRDAGARRLLALLAAVLIGYLLARMLSPRLFLPQRHLAYTLPLFALLVPVLAAAALWPRRIGPVALAASAVLLVFSGGRVLAGNGFDGGAGHAQRWLPAVARLPPDSLIAGWPTLLDSIPYLTGRSVLLSRETILPYHRGTALELRRRMQDLTQACFATNAVPLVALRDTYGVTHLLVNLPHYRRPPRIYQPYKSLVGQLNRHRQPQDFEVMRRLDQVVYRDQSYALLDLRLLERPPPGEKREP